jgi:hypothetical protein
VEDLAILRNPKKALRVDVKNATIRENAGQR